MMRAAIFLVLLGLLSAQPIQAQLTAAREAPVAMGHHHLNVTDTAAHKKFWVDSLGGRAIELGPLSLIRFPNALIFLREQEPSAGTKGSTVDHIGFAVADVRDAIARVKSQGFQIVTEQEVSGGRATSEIFHSPSQDVDLAFAMGPDGVKVELLERPGAEEPIANHHIHFAAQDTEAMRQWYVDTFDGEPGVRGLFLEAVLPGVRLTFLEAASEPAPTRGRALDHIGFEVSGLKEFCRRLEADGVTFDTPYRDVPSLGLQIAFFTDPWGTYIELTEGLDRLD